MVDIIQDLMFGKGYMVKNKRDGKSNRMMFMSKKKIKKNN